MNQFYRMDLQTAISHYQQGDLTAKGLLHIYFKIKIAPGWTISKSSKEICDELGIKKTAFYNAISRLKADGAINWTVPDSTKFSISIPFRECGNDSAIAESQFGNAENQSAIAESQFGNAENQSAIAENETSKPLPNNNSSYSPDLYSDSFQIFFKSLSQEEKEKFLNFLNLEASKLPNPPSLPLKWAESCYDDLKAKWDNFCGKNDDNSNHQNQKFGIWANHPRFKELWQGVITHGTTGYLVQNIKDANVKGFVTHCQNSPEILKEIEKCLTSSYQETN